MPLSRPRVVALSIITGKRHDLTRAELDVLGALSADGWSEADGIDDSILERLVEWGLVISDAPTPGASAHRDRHDALTDTAWHREAALYHYLTQWSDVILPDDPERFAEAARRHVLTYGPGPGHFPDVPASSTITLPAIERAGSLYRTLVSRRTPRAFDDGRTVTLGQLDTILRYVFGCHGHADGAMNIVVIKRTSPSAGALHAIEAYPIISGVADVAAGIYHYRVGEHALGLMRELDDSEAREMATAFMCGQRHLGTAHVSFVLTARFDRNYWKYREHPRAYAALLMDAAHLSQTLQLVSTDLGLGAYITLVVNGRDIETELGLDGTREGVLAVIGCGVPATPPAWLDLDFAPGPPH
jgi:putative peptide maturation dehydrogenase